LKNHIAILVLFLLAVPVLAEKPVSDKIFRPILTSKDIQPLAEVVWFGLYYDEDEIEIVRKDPGTPIKGKPTAFVAKVVGTKKHKVGYVRQELVQLGEDAGSAWVMKSNVVVQMKIGKRKLDMKRQEEYAFELSWPFRLLWATQSESDGRSSRSIRIDRKANSTSEYNVVIKTGKKSKKQIAKNIDYCLSDAVANTIWIRNTKPKADGKIVTRLLLLDELRVELVSYSIKKIINAMIRGVNVSVYNVESTYLRQQMTMSSRVDSEGRPISMMIANMFEARVEPEKIAKKLDKITELLISGKVRLDKPLGMKSSKVEEMVLEVSGDGRTCFLAGPRQAVADKGKVVHLSLGKPHGIVKSATREEIQENLKETPKYPCKQNNIVALARKAIGKSKTNVEKVKMLVKYVDKYIRNSYSDSDHISVDDIIKRRVGDCSDHAELFTVLARALGIPAKSVNGLVYMGDDTQSFCGHAWNHVVLDGIWVPVDSSLGQVEPDATHLGFGDSKVAILTSMGKLKFKLIQINGKDVE